MAKINIIGDATVVTSAVKLEDLQKIKKYRPKALTLYGGEDGKEPVFKVDVTTAHTGKIDRNGAVFGGKDQAGFATISALTPNLGDDPKKKIAEVVGVGIINLNKLEESLPAVLAEIGAELAAIEENIIVM